MKRVDPIAIDELVAVFTRRLGLDGELKRVRIVDSQQIPRSAPIRRDNSVHLIVNQRQSVSADRLDRHYLRVNVQLVVSDAVHVAVLQDQLARKSRQMNSVTVKGKRSAVQIGCSKIHAPEGEIAAARQNEEAEARVI